jgi:hypothetical protein
MLQFYDILVLIPKLEYLCLIITPSFSPPSLYSSSLHHPSPASCDHFHTESLLFPAFTLARVFDQPPVQLEPEYQAAGTQNSSRSYT